MAAVTLGVDISARWFDVAHGTEVRRFPNTAPGIAAAWAGWPASTGRPGSGWRPPAPTTCRWRRRSTRPGTPCSCATRSASPATARRCWPGPRPTPADARRIARFCEAHELAPWRPASPAHQRLHALVATRQALLQQLQQLRNREGAAGYTACQALVAELQAPVAAALTAQVARVDRELAQLAAARRRSGPSCGPW